MKVLSWLRSGKDEAEAIKAYDRGLEAKYKGEWKESLVQNQRADRLRPGDEATIWNLGIAATALRDWDEARRAWRLIGLKVINEGPGEVLASCGRACVRLNPKGGAEVVWGLRIDPARILIESVPLPSSERRYGDIILNDGAPEGYRIAHGEEFPVFDELSVWKMSEYSTFEVDLVIPNELAMERLVERCQAVQIGVEDWGTVRSLCEACSRGTPGEHSCSTKLREESCYGFGAKSEAQLRKLLEEWVEVEEGASLGGLKLVLSGVSA